GIRDLIVTGVQTCALPILVSRDTIGTTGRLTLTLPAAVTQGLLTRVPAAFHCGIQHVLLTGLALAVAQWCGRRGRGASTAVLVRSEERRVGKECRCGGGRW